MESPASKSLLPWFLLVSRSVLFVFFQGVIALLLAAGDSQSPWNASARWWVFDVILTNLISIYLLFRLFQIEGQRYLDLLRFSRQTVKKDLLWFFGSGIVGLPIVAAPMYSLGTALFGDRMIPVEMMFRPLPAWALVIGLLFPLTIGFAELPTYFGYVMPRLATQLKNGWLAWGLASLFLAGQHAFMPLILDGRFMLWRFGMYLPPLMEVLGLAEVEHNPRNNRMRAI